MNNKQQQQAQSQRTIDAGNHSWVVDRDIPVPLASRGGNQEKYPLSQMQVGESFFIPNKTPEEINMHRRAKQLGIKITQRQWEEPDGTRGTRTWRLE